MTGRLQGKKVIITGGGAGIGRESALMFAKEGAEVIVTDVDESKLPELLVSVPGIVAVKKLNVLNKNDIEDAATEIGRVDVLFNCAGIVPGGNVLETTDEQWDLAMNVNVRSAFWMCQAFIPLSLAAKHPLSIINMSSVASTVMGVPNRFSYSVSKGAMIALSKSIAADFVGCGIRVNTICPGTVDTPSFRERVSQSSNPQQALKDFIARQKMGRLGKAEEIAAMALYLASDESAYATGQEFIVDGGMSL